MNPVRLTVFYERRWGLKLVMGNNLFENSLKGGLTG